MFLLCIYLQLITLMFWSPFFSRKKCLIFANAKELRIIIRIHTLFCMAWIIIAEGCMLSHQRNMSKQGLCLLWMYYRVYIYFLNSKILFKDPSLPSVHNFIHSAKYFEHLLCTRQSLTYQKDNGKEIEVFSPHTT